MSDKRVRFDFEIDFSNGGGLQGQDFRFDIEGDDIDDATLADRVVKELRLLMVGRVRILDKSIIAEQHKRMVTTDGDSEKNGDARRFIDLSHTIEDGLVTYPGLPSPVIGDHLSRNESRARYAEGTEFQIGRIDMVANTGTYLDSPFHRYPDGVDLAGLELGSLADLEGLVVRLTGMSGRAITRSALAAMDVAGKAVLLHTGWDAHWGTHRYATGHPFLTAEAAEWLADAGAALVGIDSINIDDTADGHRPAHSTLLAAGIPIVEHLCRVDLLPVAGFRFSAVPVKVTGMGSFPVRAYAVVG